MQEEDQTLKSVGVFKKKPKPQQKNPNKPPQTN